MLTSFDHHTIVVRDLRTAVSHYSVLLGYGPRWLGVHGDLGVEAALFGLGNGMVELVAPRAGDSRAHGLAELIEQQGEGLTSLAFGTGDADACRGWLTQQGVRAAPVVEGRAGEPGGESGGASGQERSYRVVELSPRQTRGVRLQVVERPDRDLLVAQGRSSPACVEAIDHIVVSTASAQAAIEYYGERLGVRLALDRDLRGVRMLFFRLGGVTLEVVERSGIGDTDRLYGVAYRVPDADAAHARLSELGLSLTEPRAGNKQGTRVFTVRSGTCGVPTLIIADPSRRRA
ncbi:MAG: VOC family protein [Myxococcales bacterium]|nr:VOC family protein [Myxococcales bacterium]MDD9965884.1 VOC family protein [Myxococcales bacterium]